MLVILGLLALAPCAAYANEGIVDLPWPELLPPVPTTTAIQPHPVTNCADGKLDCIDDLLRRLKAQWEPLDAACDHRALWPYAYIKITQGLRDDLARRHPRYFRDKRWFTYVITTFSNRYFQAFDDYNAGRPVPEAWKITFDSALSGDANAGQDILLASNAHTQHDLPYAYAEMGLRAKNGASHKHDHNAVNYINASVFDEIEDEYARRYDPIFTYADAKPSPLDEIGAGELVKSWREGAWRNAERLVNAKTPAERQLVEQEIDATSTAWARFIAGPTVPGYRAVRDAHCRAFHASESP
jgi:hypothetical protein